jgi:hypothetical protein
MSREALSNELTLKLTPEETQSQRNHLKHPSSRSKANVKALRAARNLACCIRSHLRSLKQALCNLHFTNEETKTCQSQLVGGQELNSVSKAAQLITPPWPP